MYWGGATRREEDGVLMLRFLDVDSSNYGVAAIGKEGVERGAEEDVRNDKYEWSDDAEAESTDGGTPYSFVGRCSLRLMNATRLLSQLQAPDLHAHSTPSPIVSQWGSAPTPPRSHPSSHPTCSSGT